MFPEKVRRSNRIPNLSARLEDLYETHLEKGTQDGLEVNYLIFYLSFQRFLLLEIFVNNLFDYDRKNSSTKKLVGDCMLQKCFMISNL